jgi:hypothetical protein
MDAVTEFAYQVADALDAGEIPWRLQGFFPRGVLFGEYYPAADPIVLQIASTRLGFTSPFWGIVHEWQALGSKVIVSPEAGIRLPSNGHTVFNLEQTDRHHVPAPLAFGDSEKIVDEIVNRACIQIEHVASSDCRWIGGANERIRLPFPFMFALGPGGPGAYYDALLHEIGHWSEDRMGWTASYDLNECRAEIFSGYALGWLGIKPLPPTLAQHHHRFAPGWAKSLRQEPALLFEISRNVCKTLDFLLGFASQTIPWQEERRVLAHSPR